MPFVKCSMLELVFAICAYQCLNSYPAFIGCFETSTYFDFNQKLHCSFKEGFSLWKTETMFNSFYFVYLSSH